MLVVDRSYSILVLRTVDPDSRHPGRVTANLSETVHFGLVSYRQTQTYGSEAEMACAPGEVNVATAATTAPDIQQWLRNAPPQMA